MIQEREYAGKTVEEAVAQACLELQKKPEELRYTVVEEPKKGFLGIGSTEAKISVSIPLGAREATESFLRTFLDNAGIDAAIHCTENENGELSYTMEGEGLGLLIGHHGEVLDSLQYLLSLVTNRHGDDYVRVTLDIENYRKKRENTLRALARRTAQRVKRTGRSVTFEPMSPYERRIIHSQAQEVGGVTTHSIGSGEERRVVMTSLEEVNPAAHSAPKKEKSDAPKVVYEYNPVREPRTIVKAKSIEDINLADVEDTEMVNL